MPPKPDREGMQDIFSSSTRILKSNWWQLTYQGLYLHFASFWGPLHTSKATRAKNPLWFPQSLALWVKEYGLNLAVMLLTLTISYVYYGFISVPSVVIALTLPPLLTVIQMFIDNYLRKDIIVLYDTETKSGLTVRKVSENSYGFYNHYALPVGDRNGVPIRNWLHEIMQTRKINLQCIAQNEFIANYYLEERPGGSSKGGKRPLLAWEYSGAPTLHTRKPNLLERAVGLHSMRNSGQLPLDYSIV